MSRNKQVKLYHEPGGVYLMVLVGEGKSPNGMYDCIGEIRYPGDAEHPTLASSQVSPDYLRHRCKRTAWKALPEAWRQAFQNWVEFDLKETS